MIVKADGKRKTWSKSMLIYSSQLIPTFEVYAFNYCLSFIIISSNAFYSSFLFASAQSLITKNSLGADFPNYKFFNA